MVSVAQISSITCALMTSSRVAMIPRAYRKRSLSTLVRVDSIGMRQLHTLSEILNSSDMRPGGFALPLSFLGTCAGRCVAINLYEAGDQIPHLPIQFDLAVGGQPAFSVGSWGPLLSHGPLNWLASSAAQLGR